MLLYSQDDEMLHAELSKRWCNTRPRFHLYKNAKISMQSPYLNIEMIIKSVADVRRVPQNWHNKHDATLQCTVQ